jgi:hypothetical protein
MKLSKIFTFLKENEILVDVKTKLLTQLKEHKEEYKEKALLYLQERSVDTQSKLVDFIVDKVELPVYLKPFKGIVKKNIAKNVAKIASFIITTIEKL